MLLDLLFNMSQMFQFYFKENRHVRKMQLHLVLFALFIYTILKRIIHQSFVSTAPTYGDSRKVLEITFWLSPY